MIGRLTGRIVEEGADGSLVVDVTGVGYEVLAPLGLVGRVTPDGAGVVTIFVHTHAREDALLLYGFASRDERATFRQLIGLSNIGPKIALSILGSMSTHELAVAVSRGDSVKLTKVPGVGKKTAERIVLELKDKLTMSAPPIVSAGAIKAPPPPSGKGELLHGALTRMGYRPVEADRAVAALAASLDEKPLAELIRDALAALSSK